MHTGTAGGQNTGWLIYMHCITNTVYYSGTAGQNSGQYTGTAGPIQVNTQALQDKAQVNTVTARQNSGKYTGTAGLNTG